MSDLSADLAVLLERKRYRELQAIFAATNEGTMAAIETLMKDNLALKAELKTVAERQREACAKVAADYVDDSVLCFECRDEVSAVDFEVRATPLVGGGK